MFQFQKAAFHQIALFIHSALSPSLGAFLCLRRNDRPCLLGDNRGNKGIGIITFICQHIICLKPIDKRFRLGEFESLTGSEQYANLIAQGIHRSLHDFLCSSRRGTCPSLLPAAVFLPRRVDERERCGRHHQILQVWIITGGG
jgi:hypothetical protein